MGTRYVKTPEQVRQLLRLHAEPAFLQRRGLLVQFETDPDFIRSVLPPPLEPAAHALGSVALSEFGTSTCFGAFSGGAVTVRCRYRDIEGQYGLAMPMSTDTAVIFGRELYAEPKKLARVSVERDEATARATAERFGISLVSLRARLQERVADGVSEVNNFYFKFTLRADGSGLDHDPLLVCVTNKTTVRNGWRGAGEARFGESPHDPLADLPVLNIIGALWSEGETSTLGRTLASVPAERFLPYAFAKMDDLALLAAQVPRA